MSAYALQAGAKVASGIAQLHDAVKARVIQGGEAALDGLVNAGNRYVYQPLDATGRAVLEGYETGIELLAEPGGSVIYHTGNVISETKEKIGNLWDATKDFTADFENTLDPDYAVPGLLRTSVIRLLLKTPPATTSASGRLAITATSPAQAPYAWMTVAVPNNAGFLAFDFTITGDPREDRIVCAINEQNVFSLAAKFAPAGVPSSTDLIDISAYAGQTIELFFGLAGGTSVNCQAAIDGIRFITIPTPKVGIVASGSNVAVKWPAAASGWVLETSATLAPGSWQPVLMTGATVDRGVATFEQPATTVKKRFYRLRRVE